MKCVAALLQVMGSPSTWSNEILRQAGVLTAALSPTQISSLLLTGVDALNSMARHARLHVDQVAFFISSHVSVTTVWR